MSGTFRVTCLRPSPASLQGCILSPPLVSLYASSCVSLHTSVKRLRFADDTTLVGLISNGDDSAYSRETEHWCSSENLLVNLERTVEVVVDYGKSQTLSPPIMVGVPRESWRLPGVIPSWDLKWELNVTALRRKAQIRWYILRQVAFEGHASPVFHEHHSVHPVLLHQHFLSWPLVGQRGRLSFVCVVTSALSAGQMFFCTMRKK